MNVIIMPPRALTDVEKTAKKTLTALDETVQQFLNQYWVSEIVQYKIQKTIYGRDLTLFCNQFKDADTLEKTAKTRYMFDHTKRQKNNGTAMVDDPDHCRWDTRLAQTGVQHVGEGGGVGPGPCALR